MPVTNCDHCGACCMGQNLLPLTGNQNDVDCGVVKRNRLPAWIRIDLEEVLQGPNGGDDTSPCIWLIRVCGECKFHHLRPSYCRDFKVGGEDCLRIRKKAGLDE